MRRVTLLRQHHRQTFRRRDENVRRPLAELYALSELGVSPVRRWIRSFFSSPIPTIGARIFFPDIVSERAERRDIDALHARVERSRIQLSQKCVEDPEKCRQRFPASRRRRKQDRFTIEDRRHREELRVGQASELRPNPFFQARMQPLEKPARCGCVSLLRSAPVLLGHARSLSHAATGQSKRGLYSGVVPGRPSAVATALSRRLFILGLDRVATTESSFSVYGCPAPPDDPYICPVA